MKNLSVSKSIAMVFALALAAGVVGVFAADTDGATSGYGSGYGMGPGMMGGYGPGYGMMGGYGGYGMGPGMMGGYGMGPGMMGGYGGYGMMGGYGGYGMGPGMMGGYGMGPGMMGGYGGYGMMGMMGPGMMGGFGGYGMGPGMMGYGGFYGLDLSDAQRAKINKILDEQRKQHWGVMGGMMDAWSKLRDLYDVDQPDPKKIGAAYANIAKMHQQLIESQVQAQNQIRSVLTKEQREQLRDWNRGGGWGPRGSARDGGTMGPGMMRR